MGLVTTGIITQKCFIWKAFDNRLCRKAFLQLIQFLRISKHRLKYGVHDLILCCRWALRLFGVLPALQIEVVYLIEELGIESESCLSNWLACGRAFSRACWLACRLVCQRARVIEAFCSPLPA